MKFKNWLFGLQDRNVARKSSKGRAVATETLEVRQVPAAVALFIGVSGELNITMDGDNSVRVGSANGNVTVDASTGSGPFVRLTSIGTLPAANVRLINILGSDEPNGVDLSGVDSAVFTSLPVILVDGANGNDTLIGSPNLANSLNGGDGTDLLQGGIGIDSLNGGNGNDTIVAGDGNDSIRGGDGRDSITGGLGDDSINLGNGDDTVSAGDGNDSVFGDNGQDVINGDAGNDFLNGDGGLDTVDGGDGDDSILGGEFNDSLLGGNGNDTVNGQGGNDSVNGGDGNDSLSGAVGNDSLFGSLGNDVINGDLGNDTLLGGFGNDTMFGGAGLDSVNGEGGDDVVKGQGGRDTVIGGGGNDVVDGGDDNDLVEAVEVGAIALPSLSINDGTRIEGNPVPPFGPVTTFSLGLGNNTIGAIASNDFDGNGTIDVVVVGTFGGTNRTRVMLNDGNGVFTQGAILATGTFTQDATSADFNGDGVNDIAITDQNNDTLTVFINNGSAQFTPISVPLTPFSNPTGIAAGDLDADGDQDLVVANSFRDSISILTNDGLANFNRTDLALGQGFFSDPVDLVIDDLDGDNDLDIAVSLGFGNTTADVVIVLNGGSGFFVGSTVDNLGNNLNQMASLDYDNDSDRDLVVADDFNNRINVLRNDGGGGFNLQTTLLLPNFAGNIFVATGDFNLDGNDDVVAVSDSFNQAVSVFQGNGDGTFQPRLNVSLPNIFFSRGGPTVARDFNADGALDLAIGADFGDSLFILLNTTANNIPRINLDITLSQPVAVPVTVNYSTADGTASGNSDYNPTSGTVTFAPGEVVKTITVISRVDIDPESTENFFVNLTGATNAVIGDGTAQVLLIDDDRGPTASTLAISGSVTRPEGTGGLATLPFTVTLANPPTTTVTVDFSTADGTAVGNSDYVPLSGTLTFAPGTTTQTINVQVIGDSRSELTENFFVNLSNPVNAVMTASRAQITITDDDVISGIATLLGSNGDDTLLGSEIADFINGGAGNDLIRAGDGPDSVLGGGGKDTLDGEAGDDTLDGQAGDDSLIGGDGLDTFLFGGLGSGNDTGDGGDGLNTISAIGTSLADTLNVSQINGLLTVSSGTNTLTASANVQSVLVDGRGGNDTITVASLLGVQRMRVEIRGGEGNDLLDAFNANPGSVRLSLFGDDGNDTINGSLGNDTINGGTGDDSCCGFAGDDTMIGEAGNDSLGGSLGNDSINGGDGNDLLNGQKGDDSVAGGIGDDTLKGEDGNDVLSGELGDDQLNGGAGNDSLTGSSGRDALVGGAGNDTLQGGRNDDTINGNSGDDLIRGDHGHDFIDAGTGADSVGGGDGDDTIVTFDGNDFVSGGDGNDRINTSSGDDVISGGDGNDTILGGGGNDIILGGNGEDVIDGQGGTDIVAGQQGVDFISDPLTEINEAYVLNVTLAAILKSL